MPNTPKHAPNGITCALLSVVLFILLILSRCHGPNRPAEHPGVESQPVRILLVYK